MAKASVEQLVQRALELGLITSRQSQEVWTGLDSQTASINDVVQFLVRREYLTNYQVERLAKGERTGFFYGRYKVQYLVGSGSFARVFRAVQRDTGEIVAIKAMKSHYGDSATQAASFLREGRVGISLRHPNIVRTYDVASEGKIPYLVMEFVEGWSLRDFVKIRKKVDPLQATRLMMDMVEGLRYAFDLGMTHRDLKLTNVLVTSSGQAKLVDFGLASISETFSDEMFVDSLNTRTVDYATLERATGVQKGDNRSDIYFLGCIFYHMLTGEPPLAEARDRFQRLSKARFLNIIPVQKAEPTLHPSVVMAVNKALTFDPTKRYQTPAAMLTDLTNAESQLLKAAEMGASKAASGSAIVSNGTAASSEPAAPQRSVMVVESDPKMQDVFREGFKRVGYRVLVIADPERAVSRFHQDNSVADCVIFSSQELGEAALAGFNALMEDSRTNFVRAMLLLEESHKDWQNRAIQASYRVVLTMPITLKQLRSTLASLIETSSSTAGRR